MVIIYDTTIRTYMAINKIIAAVFNMIPSPPVSSTPRACAARGQSLRKVRFRMSDRILRGFIPFLRALPLCQSTSCHAKAAGPYHSLCYDKVSPLGYS